MKDWLLVIGMAPNVMEDLQKLGDLSRFDKMVITHTNKDFKVDNIQYLVSHQADFEVAKAFRAQNGLNTDYTTYSTDAYPGVMNVLPQFRGPTCSFSCNPRLPSRDPRNHHHYSGSSALLGVKIGLLLGYKKVVVAGVALSGRYKSFQKGWAWYAPVLQRCPIRAVSGYLAAMLGPFTEVWLNE